MSAPGPSTQADIDTALRVVVTPSQSSFFAGEPLSVTVTITNIRTPQSPSSQRPSQTHKRSAHSVSSAPLARPPTSPGLLRAASTSVPKSGVVKDAPTKKGLIGRSRLSPPKGADELPELSKDMKKRFGGKSLSVHVLSPHDLDEQLRGGAGSKVLSAVQRNDDGRILTPSSPRISSPLARTPVLPANHPHARKQSVLDGSQGAPPLVTSPIPQSASASTTTFAVSLDPIAESGSSPIPPTPNFPSPVPTPAPFTTGSVANPASHSYPPRAPPPPPPPAPRHPSQLGLGHGPPPNGTTPLPPRSAFSSTFPPPLTELVLYAYVQFTGTLALAPPQSAARSPALAALRTRVAKRYPRGGGSMDITSSLDGGAAIEAPRPRRQSHARSSSLSASLFSLLSPAPPQGPGGFVRGHKARAPSYVASFFAQDAGAASAVGLGLGMPEEEWDPETPLPVFDIPPAMLAVDLTLGPGESRTYTYAVNLPSYLPPTYKGRTLRFSYQLSVGTCRAGANQGPATPSGANSNSRVMKVPIRVYNHVAVDKPQLPYNLLMPAMASFNRPQAKVTEDISKALNGTVKRRAPTAAPSAAPSQGSVGSLRTYGRRLLASAEQLHSEKQNGSSSPSPSPLHEDQDRESEGTLKGCREAVEILTRVPKKISYDVNKDGVKVAVLTFMKAAYRLGETVVGVVELNERESRARVLKLSAMLEAHESLPASLSSASDARHMRRVHAEYHSSFVVSALRTTFTLDIPSDASPAFRISLGEPPLGGLEWKVRLCLLVAVADSARTKQLVRDGPRGEWGSAWVPTAGIAPLERPAPKSPPAPPSPPVAPRFWSALFSSTFLGPGEGGFHDGDEASEGEDAASLGEGEVDLGAGEEGWQPVRIETVECEVPVKVWPGNTAFRAMDVVFDV